MSSRQHDSHLDRHRTMRRAGCSHPRSASHPLTARRPLPTAPAFTLIELLIVLAIITVVVALGIPLFGALTGAKSVEAGQNVVSATIGAARTTAVNEGKFAGVLFYIDPATERTAMSLVIVNDPRSGLEDPDPYDKYKTWVSGAPAAGVTYKYTAANTATGDRADRVIAIAVDGDATYKGSTYVGPNSNPSKFMDFFGSYRPVVRTYRCTESHATAGAANDPAKNGPYTDPPDPYVTLPTPAFGTAPSAESVNTPFANQYWDGQPNQTITPFAAAEQQLLPPGVGVQVIVQQLTVGTTATPADRYLRTALIMFDSQGRLVTDRTFTLAKDSTIATALGLDTSATVVMPQFSTGMGVVFYDEATFKNASYTNADATLASTTTGTPDVIQMQFDATTLAGQAMNTLMGTPPTAAVEATGTTSEETWLDNNTVPLLINRFSGSLSSTQ